MIANLTKCPAFSDKSTELPSIQKYNAIGMKRANYICILYQCSIAIDFPRENSKSIPALAPKPCTLKLARTKMFYYNYCLSHGIAGRLYFPK